MKSDSLPAIYEMMNQLHAVLQLAYFILDQKEITVEQRCCVNQRLSVLGVLNND